MHRNHRSSSKQRSRSPSAIPSSPVSVRHRDPLPRTFDLDQGRPHHDAKLSSESESPQTRETGPKIPAFLELSEEGIIKKFMTIMQLENERKVASRRPNGDTQWSFIKYDKVLDRYNNIYPWFHNRITLEVPEGVNSYINASPVSLSAVAAASKPQGQDKFIAMQGPKMETIDHTWMMIWQSLSNPSRTTPAVIVMLTPTHVNHAPEGPPIIQEKCYPYYPLDEESEPLQINDTSALGAEFKATVRFVAREETCQGEAIELRKLVMKVDGCDDEKIIWHFLYPGWPDFGALEESDIESITKLMHLSREKNTSPENPRIVHCSAGVGRSGTFIALEHLMAELEAGAWESLPEDQDPIFETVNNLRMQRPTMVQAPEQYRFLYSALKKFWEDRYTARTQ
ncbi:protein-tyrosine phosphatase [Phlyctema vagabunda]|uniref:Protein-tyrosine phosphatase n=1 Tax=Phlyctema vagabunda TaxID=108571 RepID=A0ABR4PSP9_9HELO